MSIRSLESAITSEARRHFNNPRLRVKDLMEWSTSEVKAEPGEAAELANLAGKMIGSAKVQVEYYALRKEAPTIEFLRAPYAD